MSDSSLYVNSIYEAIKTISDNSSANSGAPKTIECKIESIEDAGKGEYKVSYLADTFSAFSNSSVTYSVGDTVYILVPEGDFSKKKIILGSISSLGKTYSDSSSSDDYEDISDNLITANFGDVINLTSYYDAGIEKSIFATGTSTAQIKELIDGYINDYGYFKLSAKFKTDLPLAHQGNGNYGIYLSIPIVSEDGLKKETQIFRLDTTTMLGSPFWYEDYSEQSIYFKLEGKYDDSNENGIMLYYFSDWDINDESHQTDYNIFIKDINLKSVYKLQDSDYTGYKLSIKASEGLYFTGYNKTSKTLTAILKLNGKTTKFDSNTQYYWFIEDSDIKTTKDDGYSNNAGVGWRCLNDKTNIKTLEDGTTSFTYKTDSDTLSIKKDDITSATRFKLVTILGDSSNVLKSEITLKNLQSDRILKIFCDSTNNKYIANSGQAIISVYAYVKNVTDNQDNLSAITYSFVRYGNDGNLISDSESPFIIVTDNALDNYDINGDGVEEAVFKATYKIDINKIEEYNTFYCSGKYQIVNKDKSITRKDVGTSSLTISTTETSKYNLDIKNDDKMYKYDAEGNSPMIEAYDGAAASKITTIDPLSFVIYKEDGNEFSDAEYASCSYTWTFPKSSLIRLTDEEINGDNKIVSSSDDDNYYISGTGKSNDIIYQLYERYSDEGANLGVSLSVTFNGEVLKGTPSIYFLKDGSNGTNGTSYAALLVAGYNKDSDQVKPYGVKYNGIAQKIKVIYSTYEEDHVQSHHYGFFICNMETGVIEDWNTIPKIYPRVYYNGTILDESYYSVEYSMFDSTKDATNVYITVKTNSDKSATIDCDTSKSPAIKMDTQSVNIVQAKFTINNQSDSNDTQILYAYYPIELLTIDSFVSLDSFIGKNYIMPTVNGGYYNVLYNSEGLNPTYEDKVFYLDNFDGMEYFSVSWNAQNHLSTPAEGLKDSATGTVDHSKAKVVPDNKYTDGNTLNYVDALITLNKNSEVKAQDEQYTKDTENIEKLNTALEAFKESYEIQEEGKSYTTKYDGVEVLYENFGKDWDLAPIVINKYEDIESPIENVIYNFIQTEGKTLAKTGYYIYDKTAGWVALASLDDYKREFGYYTTILKNISEDFFNPRHAIIQELKEFFTYYDTTILLLSQSSFNELKALLTDGTTLPLDKFLNSYNEVLSALLSKEAYYRTISLPFGELDADSLSEASEKINLYIEEKRQSAEEDAELKINAGKILLDRINIFYNSSLSFNDILNTSEDSFVNRVQNDIGFKHGLEVFNQLIINIMKIVKTCIDGVDKAITFIRTTIEDENYRSESVDKINMSLNYIYEDFDTIMWSQESYKDCFNFLSDLHVYNILYYYNQCTIDKKINSYILSDISEASLRNDEEYFAYNINLLQIDMAKIGQSVGLDHLVIKYSRPILMTMNRYERTCFNAWDGNKIYVDDDESYLMAPQMGAGYKNSDNTFTGIFMGHKVPAGNKTAEATKRQYGLFGYYHDEQSFYLSADNGSATFGLPSGEGGQIIIDPASETALLYNSNFFNATTGWDGDTGLPVNSAYSEAAKRIAYEEDDSKITKAYTTSDGMLIDLTTPGIIFGNGNFKVTPKGHLFARGGGDIAGWHIGDHDLTSGTFEEGVEGIQLDADVGKIVLGSSSGKIYSGEHTELENEEEGFYIDQSGLSIGPNFKVSSTGKIELGAGASKSSSQSSHPHWVIDATPIIDEDGNITSYNSYIKYNEKESQTSVYIGTDGIALGSNFKVDNQGNLVASSGTFSGTINATGGGTIGNWTIDIENGGRLVGKDSGGSTKQLVLDPSGKIIYNNATIDSSSKGFYLGSNGLSIGDGFKVALNGEGNYISGKIVASEGRIGNWVIKGSADAGASHNVGAIYWDWTGISSESKKYDTNNARCCPIIIEGDQLYTSYLDDYGIYHYWQMNNSGNVFFSDLYVRSSAEGDNPQAHFEGATITGGTFVGGTWNGESSTSDIRYKTLESNYMSLDISKKIIMDITPIAYHLNDDEKQTHYRGFSAQQVRDKIHELGLPETIYRYDEKQDKYYLDKEQLIPDMVNCIQDLYKEIDTLKEQLKEIKGCLN